jgi:hypothetical protein
MENLIVLFWWFVISKYSIYNIEKLYYLEYNKNNIIAKHVYYTSWIFIIACSIRSIFPRIDGQRTCLFDTWLSYPLVGRICATFGEIAFVYQLTLVTKSFARKLDCVSIYKGMNIVMILIYLAQILCWYGVLFKKNLMHVIEEFIWMIAMLSIGFSYLYFSDLVRYDLTKYKFLLAFIISIGYGIFMMFIDVPMYYDRFVKYNSSTSLSFSDSINDMYSCKVTSSSYSTWKSEILWMTGYFIGATYLSIKLNNFQELLI